ncbi:MAG: hypothetical protein EOM11_09940 [Erysipelotrichia bacterium]|nr:hypothetical protein [Erysipelotrichia bacterium]
MGVIFDKKIERLILPNNTSVSSNEFRLLKALCKAAKIPFITVEEKLVSCCTQMELVLKETKLSYPYEYKQCLTRLLNEQQ